MSTGENEMGLRKILDMTRFASFSILLMHFYFYCYGIFASFGIRSEITDRILVNIASTGLFNNFENSKLIALGLLLVSLWGASGKKSEKIHPKRIAISLTTGLIFFFSASKVFSLSTSPQATAISYMLATTTGYLLILSGGTQLSRLIHEKLDKDIFNESNETFPQEERLINTPHSVNLSARYQLQGKWRHSKINFINNYRGLIVAGLPGAGKTRFVILPLIKQMIEKGFALFIYDFKFGDLTIPAYNWLQSNKNKFKNPPSFYSINFDDPETSHRCNPLDPKGMDDITDAAEAARTILLGLNKSWIKQQGQFFIESAINFLTAIIWYLKKYGNGDLCTMPHAIEMMQVDYESLFAVLNTEPEVHAYISDFIKAYEDDVMETLSSQIASAKVAVARISSPKLYWVLTGNDFSFDINNPLSPKIVCVGNNAPKKGVYGAALSLCTARMARLVNRKGQQKCGLIFEEFPTLFFNDLDSQILATARSNEVATVLCMQNFNQLTKDYGKDQADVIVNLCGNIISGQVFGESAKILSERFGKIVQDKKSLSLGQNGTSVSKSTQLDYAIPASKIASLSSGEFVGMVADEPHQKIKLKMFHSEIIHDNSIDQDAKNFVPLPKVRTVSPQELSDNFYQVKQDVHALIEQEKYRINLKDNEIDEY